jgi:hypothetical protein
MACDLALGRIEPCKDSVGGLKNLYFVNYGDLGAITYDVTNTDVIDTVAGTPDAYKYEIKGASSFTQNIQSSRDTGTTAFEQVIEVTLKKLTIADHKELKILAYGRPHVIVEDYNGNFFLAGLEHGAEVTGGTIVTGTAMSDLSGYTLTLTGMERTPANFLGDTPENVGFTIVAGA